MGISYTHWILIWTILGLLILPMALYITAPYGRHIRAGWGPVMSNRLGWIIMELPVLILVPLLCYIGPIAKTVISTILIAVFVLHYFNRVFIYPMRIQTQGKTIPLSIVIFAFVFNLINGFNIGYYFGFLQTYPLDWSHDIRFILGIFVFFSGMFINWKSDSILINLRAPGELGYKIPNGFLFRYISCPNHLGEIIEWIGFAIMTWSLPAASFAIWTVANLLPRSINHHVWYKKTFDDYPPKRRALIPYIL